MKDSMGERPRRPPSEFENVATFLCHPQNVDILLIFGFLGTLLHVEISKLEKVKGQGG